MALPKEPRQKMINLMYLVLTAMLALNISAEILNAFKNVDNSLAATNRTIDQSTATIMASLDEKRSDPASAAKANLWYPKAQQAQQLSKEMFDYIQGLRTKILAGAGFDPTKQKDGKPDSTYKEDNQDVSTRIMITEKEGEKLQQKLEAYKQALLNLDPAIKSQFQNALQINTATPPATGEGHGNANRTWSSAYFNMVPTVAAITMLSKFQNDVRTSENKVVAFCHEQVGKVAVRFDTYTAIVGQSSNYVMPGQEIEVMAGVGAFSRAAQPQITINGQGAALGEDGAARVKFVANGIGERTVPVTIRYVDQEGKAQTITKTISYTIGQASASIALDKMNVLYIGVDNPVTVAASGGGGDRVQATISGGGGSLIKVGPGKYIAKVQNQTDNATITVTVDGKVAGASQFRVRSIPDPIARVGTYRASSVPSASAFKQQAGVSASVPDFPYDLKYTVTSFLITGDGEGFDEIAEATNRGNTWGPEAQNIIRRVRPGSFITIENIKAIGPDGRTRTLEPLLFNVK